jgi:beta-galactosidase
MKMKLQPIFTNMYLFLVAVFILTTCYPSDKTASRDRLFDNGWKFLRDSITGAEAVDFDDAGWRDVDLPHDWSIEDLPGESDSLQTGPFSKLSPGAASTGHVLGGTAWYRKHFRLSLKDGCSAILRFDGVYMESEVWVNGQHVGYHPYGYTPFNYDITPYLNKKGEQNVVAVQVRNTGKNSRWYSGSGIYRNVWLTVLEPVHIEPWGVFITTPEVSRDSALVNFQVTLFNKLQEAQEITLNTSITDPSQLVVAVKETNVTIAANDKIVITQSLPIDNPLLWSPQSPGLYKASFTVGTSTGPTDLYDCTFGIRSIRFSKEEGFLLNGEPVELKGACMHHDNGLLGSAAFDRAEERRVEIMKANGYNAIRTSHNPPSQAFLDVCDRLGMLVIDEAFDMWAIPKNPQDYARFFNEYYAADLTSMLLRDRSHPCIIIWSIGNEINERADPSGVEIAGKLVEVIRDYDTTRPITAAICHFWDHPGRTWEQTAPAFQHLDIGGYNYQWKSYEPDHQKFPERIMMGTESFPIEAWENWQLVKKYTWIIGDFVWTGMDYLGESGIGHVDNLTDTETVPFLRPWPWFVAWCGDIDICGNKKPQSYYRDVVWDNSRLEIAVHPPVPEGKKERISGWGWTDEYQSWNWAGQEGRPMQVSVYSSFPAVRLELNGKVIGEQTITAGSGITARFTVPYEPGVLTAIGLEDGKEIERKVLGTSGAPAGIQLTAEQQEIKAGRDVIAYVQVEAIDEAGNLVPDASLRVSVTVSGPAEILAAGNASPDQMESLKDPAFNTFRGKALVIIRSDGNAGNITITAEAEGLMPGSVTVIALK